MKLEKTLKDGNGGSNTSLTENRTEPAQINSAGTLFLWQELSKVIEIIMSHRSTGKPNIFTEEKKKQMLSLWEIMNFTENTVT